MWISPNYLSKNAFLKIFFGLDADIGTVDHIKQ